MPELSPAFDDLIAEMLAKDPMERPQTMGAVQRALHHASGVRLSMGDMPPVPTAPSPPGPIPAAMIEPPEPPPPVAPCSPSTPPERLEIPAAADPYALSGVVLVPAGGAGSPGGAPAALPAASRARQHAMVLGAAVVAALLLALATIAL